MVQWFADASSQARALDEHTLLSQLREEAIRGPPGYIGWTRFQPM
jgi:hypothetical protein